MARKRKAKRKAKPKRTRKTGHPTADTPDWAPAFLAAILDGLHVRDACIEANIEGTRPYKRRVDDADFRKAWDEAADIGTKALEREVSRRAYHGTLKPVYQQGWLIGHVREYSDTLIMFLLRARRPKKYRENVKMEHAGRVDMRHKIGTDGMTDDDLARIAAGEPATSSGGTSAPSPGPA